MFIEISNRFIDNSSCLDIFTIKSDGYRTMDIKQHIKCLIWFVAWITRGYHDYRDYESVTDTLFFAKGYWLLDKKIFYLISLAIEYICVILNKNSLLYINNFGTFGRQFENGLSWIHPRVETTISVLVSFVPSLPPPSPLHHISGGTMVHRHFLLWSFTLFQFDIEFFLLFYTKKKYLV